MHPRSEQPGNSWNPLNCHHVKAFHKWQRMGDGFQLLHLPLQVSVYQKGRVVGTVTNQVLKQRSHCLYTGREVWMTSSSKYPSAALQFLSLSLSLEAAHPETVHQSTSRLTRMSNSFLQIPPVVFVGLFLFLLLAGAEEFWLLTTGLYLPINY